VKRLILSLIGGVVIPTGYTIVAGMLSTYIDNYTVRNLSYIPIGWPRFILERLVPLDSFPFRNEDFTALLLIIIISNVVLYSLMTYLFLWILSKRTPKVRAEPPPPHLS
jgi:hypothetical protein